MNSMSKIPLFFFPVIYLCTGCIIYPHSTDIPLIKEKNDLHVDAGVSSTMDAAATVSYGLTEKIAVQGFGSYGSDNKHHVQGAVGYYKAAGNNQIFEWYTGLGYGYGDAYKSANPGHLFGDYYLGFTQFNFGKVNTRFANTDFGIALKTGYLSTNFTDRNYYGIYYSGDNLQGDLFPELKDNGVLLQPGAFARIGGEKLKFSIKANGMWLYKFTNQDKKLPVAHFDAGLGLNYNIRTKQ